MTRIMKSAYDLLVAWVKFLLIYPDWMVRVWLPFRCKRAYVLWRIRSLRREIDREIDRRARLP